MLMVPAALVLGACGADLSDLVGGARKSLAAPADCVVSGCSGEVCAESSMESICIWRAEFACYETAQCARQADGQCGWTMDAQLSSCLQQHAPPPQDGGSAPGACVVSGCSGQLCADEVLGSDCQWKEEYACYANAQCERQADGNCGWTMDSALTQCLADKGDEDGGTGEPLDGGQAPNPCVVTGCSAQLCSEHELSTTCEWKDEYACYANAKCEPQANGACGWTVDAALSQCLASAGAP